MDTSRTNGYTDLYSKAGICGELAAAENITEIYGIPFDGYRLELLTYHRNDKGSTDNITVLVPAEAMDMDTVPDSGVIDGGTKMIVIGKAQSLYDFKTDTVLIFVLAEYCGVAHEQVEIQDAVEVLGEISKPVVTRETPSGLHITELMLRVPSMLHGGYSYLPIVCWQAEADEAAGWDMGDKISVRGRMQSRTYIKVVRGEATERIAREISARKVTRVKHVYQDL